MNRPEIQSIMLTPNPVNAKGTVKIAVQVIDKEIVFKKPVEYTGEIYAGQQIGVI